MKLGDVFVSERISVEESLNFVSDGLMVVNSKLEVLFFNEAAKTICGVVANGSYLHWPNYIGLFQEDRKTIFSPEKLPLVRAARGEVIKDLRLWIKNAFLEDWKCVSCNATPVKDGDLIVGAILCFRDITEVLRREEEIKKEREAYHKILNSLPAFVFTKDLLGNYTFVNQKYSEEIQKTFGVAPTKNFLGPEISKGIAIRDWKVMSSGKAQEFEEEYPFGPGGYRVYRTTRIPLMDHNQTVYGICGISFDITEERERKKSLEDERLKIATASKLAALGMLAAELGHEINNPLAIIRTSSWIMRKILNSDNFQRDLALVKLDEIDVTIQRISDIVTSVKNLSRDSSRETMNDYVLDDIIRDVKSICWTKFHPKGISFHVNSSNPLMKEIIHCYRVQLSEVFINLIVNAADAIEDSNNPWINLDVSGDEEKIIFRFTDSGPGVTAGLERKIFAPFFSTKDIGKGTGLGLSISKEIMKRHGGDLTLNREISDSCFEVVLPRRKNR